MSAADDVPDRFAAEKVMDSDEILAGRTEVVILHRGQAYRLRLTRQDKLILTK
ncbi:hemin uptake protein HemP [Devosia sp. FJ2-5-3]|jgi:hemin uptake protein HemP|uniref:hemin uptake protein HemP n=1 Tax=Devosia sp. FJ2-5-3 TaxID=2976680 RepID=UPI0023D7F652|nr:hemin uptake protein HemP [Devosia sp. FJ2-5-3]WEJ58335.1 hemin uptake protein HemP [Devosia sp. FJ2-5-3]